MEISLEEAKNIANRYAKRAPASWFDNTVVEKETYWFLRVGYIGSSGVIVEKKTGNILPIGSGHPIEDWLWFYEAGYNFGLYDVVIRSVKNKNEIIEFLIKLNWQIKGFPIPSFHNRDKERDQEYKEAGLALENLPKKYMDIELWRCIPWLRNNIQSGNLVDCIPHSELEFFT